MTKLAFILSKKELKKLRMLAKKAQRLGQHEVCGLILIGSHGKLSLQFLENKSNQEGKYEINLRDVREICSKLRNQKIFGSFHSHPIWEATPSKSDLKNGFYKNRELIYDVCGDEVVLWKRKVVKGKVVVERIELSIR